MLASLEEFSIFHKRNKATQWIYNLAKLKKKKKKKKKNRLKTITIGSQCVTAIPQSEKKVSPL